MRIAFYAPMKPPDSPVPSGDRTIARSLIKALEIGKHEVTIASRLQSREPEGEPDRQRALREEGQAIAQSLVEEYHTGQQPDLWFTYHLYYKAPDWIGPLVSEELGIPYVAAEVSHAPKRAGGPWDESHQYVEKTIKQADLIVGLNSLDAECVRPLVSGPEKMMQLRPFMDEPLVHRSGSHRLREFWGKRLGIPQDKPWLLTAAMMRPGAKQESYEVLATALKQLNQDSFELVIAGDGPARDEVKSLYKSLPVYFAGELEFDELLTLMAASDLFVWPAIDEAYGMAILEAHSQALPVVAGKSGGVGDIVRDGETGALTPAGEADTFAAAVKELISDQARRQAMSISARSVFERDHTLSVAAADLNRALEGLVHG